MKRLFEINDEMYYTQVKVFVGTNKQVDAYVKKNITREEYHVNDGCAGSLLEFKGIATGDMTYVLWIEQYPYKLTDWITVTHEVNHLAFRTMELVGIQDEEAHCYYHDYMLKKILRTLNKEIENDKK